jgi:hypothetical protein
MFSTISKEKHGRIKNEKITVKALGLFRKASKKDVALALGLRFRWLLIGSHGIGGTSRLVRGRHETWIKLEKIIKIIKRFLKNPCIISQMILKVGTIFSNTIKN